MIVVSTRLCWSKSLSLVCASCILISVHCHIPSSSIIHQTDIWHRSEICWGQLPTRPLTSHSTPPPPPFPPHFPPPPIPSPPLYRPHPLNYLTLPQVYRYMGVQLVLLYMYQNEKPYILQVLFSLPPPLSPIPPLMEILLLA